jgi:SulP family sulfate permease
MSALSRHLPAWLRSYSRENLPHDVLAGLVVTVLVIPQSLAYALLAGLPPQAGLYAGILPVLAYALFGSSMTQAVGPVAITAIMTFAVLSPLAEPQSAHYIALAATLALMSGVMVLVSGLLRMGSLSQLLSRPVISGFISGSAILIVVSQVKFLTRIPMSEPKVWQVMAAVYQRWGESIDETLMLGSGSLLALTLSRYFLAGWLCRLGISPARADIAVRIMPLLTLAVTTAVVAELQLDVRHGVAVVGTIAASLTALHLFVPGLETLQQLAGPAVLLAVIGMVQNITMAQALAIKRRERVDANHELVGLGSANIVAAVSGGLPVGGGLSRTAVNLAAGARTPLATIVAALGMLGVLALGTQWLSRLPLAVLAASIIVAAISMLDFKALEQAWRYDRADGLALLGTASGVVVLGVEWGIALGVGLSLAALLIRASTPHIAVIGRIAGTEHFRNVQRHGVETIAGVLLLRVDESLFFGNLGAIELRISQELEHDRTLHDVVLIMSAVNRVDATAMEVLTDINRDLATRNIRFHLAEVKGPVQDRLARSPLWESLSGEVYLSVNAAFENLQTMQGTR